MTRILVVEDSPTQAEAARAILESAGYEVVVAPDGRSALGVAEENFDVIISDIMMPEMTGYDLCRAVKTAEATKNLPVILLTTLSDPMDIIQGLESGADNFITKPYKPEYLIERVRTLLENKALRAGKSKVSVEIMFLGKVFSISSDREQILDLLIATFEDMVRTNRSLQATQADLSAANAKIEEYARALEGQVRRSEEKYRTLMEEAPDAIMIFNAGGTLIEINECVEELLGRSADDVLGSRIDDVLNREVAAQFERFVADSNGREGGTEIRRSDGTTRLVDYRLSLSEVGDARVVIAVVRDITARKELERQVNEASKFSAVARLASGAAHDFNNVLMAILAYAEVLLRQLPEGQATRRSAEEIRKAAKRGSWLTGQLLAFTRSGDGGEEPTDINDVLRNVEEMLRQLVGNQIKLEMALEVAPSLVSIEPGFVEQIVMNLAVNARDAMPAGGKITIETSNIIVHDPQAIGHPELRAGNYVSLCVRDTGAGMTRDTIDKIFTPLFTTKERGRGTGLGLAIVQTIVSDVEGWIAVDSEPGRGTEFTVFLPRADSRPGAERAAARPDVRGSESVLVIHPDASIRSLLREVLVAHGYVVHTAADRAEAHACSENLEKLDVVVAEHRGDEAKHALIPENVLDRCPVVEMPRPNGSPAAPIGADDLLVKIREALDR